MSPLEALAWLGIATLAATVLLVMWLVVAAFRLSVEQSRARAQESEPTTRRADS